MKKFSLILLAFTSVIFTQYSCKSDKSNTKAINTGDAGRPSTLIAYVDIDSFEANYEYLKEQRKKFTDRKEAMQSELERSAQQLQSSAQTADQKARSGGMTEAEFTATQKKTGADATEFTTARTVAYKSITKRARRIQYQTKEGSRFFFKRI